MDVEALADQIEAEALNLQVRNTAALRSLRRVYSKKLRRTSGDEVLALARALVGRGTVHRFVADELVAAHAGAMAMLTPPLLRELAGRFGSWDEVDSFATSIAGSAWRAGVIADEVILNWARSTDRWWRRAALVATVPLNVKARGGSGDARRTLLVCEALVPDRDDTVVKALSWALRELVPRDPEAVRAFLAQYEGGLAALIRREVRQKLMTGAKSPSKA